MPKRFNTPVLHIAASEVAAAWLRQKQRNDGASVGVRPYAALDRLARAVNPITNCPECDSARGHEHGPECSGSNP